MNVKIDTKLVKEDYYTALWRIVKKMDSNFKPFDLNWNGVKWGEIHFSDPKLITRLKWMPYIETLSGILFIFVVFWAFRIIRQSDRNSIYVGMAKETAHQLGTPISSLMGWVKLLNDDNNERLPILKSMDKDLARLKDISQRFYKIGSNPKLKSVNIYYLINDIIQYMRLRLPQKSKISLELSGDHNSEIKGDKILLIWAIENLIKNSVDAILDLEGEIKIDIKNNKNKIFIYISDTGKGILRKNWKKIFDPGYSTKKRGWGLGLSLATRIISEIHNGEIYLYNSKPRKTIFHISFIK